MKKLLSAVLSLTMIVSMSNLTFAAPKVHVEVETQALTTHGSVKGALPARQKDIASALNTHLKTRERDLLSSSLFEKRSVKGGWIKLSDYQVFNQITDYNCGPASVQAALNYINGSTPNQSVIAKGCKTNSQGSYLVDLRKYINSKQSKNPYEEMYDKNFSTMKDCLYTGIVSYDAPPIIGMSFSSNDGWLYSSGGHFMSVYGVKSDKSSFMLGDPWIGYSDSGFNGYSWSYSKSASDIYNAYKSADIGFMY